MKLNLLFKSGLRPVRFIIFLSRRCLCILRDELNYIEVVILRVDIYNGQGVLVIWCFLEFRLRRHVNLWFFAILYNTIVLAPLILRCNVFHVKQDIWEVEICRLILDGDLFKYLLLNNELWLIVLILARALPPKYLRLWFGFHSCAYPPDGTTALLDTLALRALILSCHHLLRELMRPVLLLMKVPLALYLLVYI